MVNYKEPEFNLTVPEADLPVYMRVYRTLKDTFATETRMVILHIEREIYEFRLIGLGSRDVLEFCANVFAELPTKNVNLVEEAQEYSLSDPEGTEEEDSEEVEPEDAEAEDELESDDDDSEEEEPEDSEEESPSEEVERKLGTGNQLKKAKLVRKTGNNAVTVESD